MSTLVEARDAIVEHGWIQRAYGSPAAGFCILGALGYVTVDNGYDTVTQAQFTEARDKLFAELNRSEWKSHRSLAGFNDYEETTQDDVLALFDRAIAREFEHVGA